MRMLGDLKDVKKEKAQWKPAQAWRRGMLGKRGRWHSRRKQELLSPHLSYPSRDPEAGLSGEADPLTGVTCLPPTTQGFFKSQASNNQHRS